MGALGEWKQEMKNLIIAEFVANPDKVADLEDVFRLELGATRAFDGCVSLDVYFEVDASTFTLVEDWESFEQYDKYLDWRMGTDLPGRLDPILAGGMAGGFSVRKFESKDL